MPSDLALRHARAMVTVHQVYPTVVAASACGPCWQTSLVSRQDGRLLPLGPVYAARGHADTVAMWAAEEIATAIDAALSESLGVAVGAAHREG